MHKKICVMTSAHPPLDVRIFLKECRSLARAGYRVTLISPAKKDCRVDGVSVRAFPRYATRRQRFISGALEMYRMARRESADVYHFHDPELIPVALLLRATGKTVVYDVHEDLPKTIAYKTYIPRWLRNPLQMVVRIAEEYAAKLMSGLIAATSPIADRFSEVRAKAVVHNYPLLQEFAATIHEPGSNSGNYIAYVGARVTSGRGAAEMVEAMGLLPPEVTVQLKIAGAFDPPQLPERLSEIVGWKRVEVLGVLGRTEVAELLQHARAGLVLLHPEPNYLNAQPVKLFEYMGAGIPVIASDFPVWRNVVETTGCGLLVNPLDSTAIAGAIEYLCTHPEEAAEMGRRGRAAVEARYNWDREEEELLHFYKGLAGARQKAVSTSVEARA